MKKPDFQASWREFLTTNLWLTKIDASDVEPALLCVRWKHSLFDNEWCMCKNPPARIVRCAFHHALSSLSRYRRVIDLRVALVGSNLDTVLLALMLRHRHDIIIIEQEAEMGLPAMHPGRILDPIQLEEWLSPAQIKFLSLREGLHGFGCRWEWMVKFFAALAATNGIHCRTRTRITAIEPDDEGFLLHFSSREREEIESLHVHRLVNTTAISQPGPGLRHHESLLEHAETYLQPEHSCRWKGGIVVTATQSDWPQDVRLNLPRSDGTTELWWDTPTTWMPQQGFIEQCEVTLAADVDALSFDAMLRKASHFVECFES